MRRSLISYSSNSFKWSVGNLLILLKSKFIEIDFQIFCKCLINDFLFKYGWMLDFPFIFLLNKVCICSVLEFTTAILLWLPLHLFTGLFPFINRPETITPFNFKKLSYLIKYYNYLKIPIPQH